MRVPLVLTLSLLPVGLVCARAQDPPTEVLQPIYVTAPGSSNMTGDILLSVNLDTKGFVTSATSTSKDSKMVEGAIGVAKLFPHRSLAGKTGLSERIHFTQKSDFVTPLQVQYPEAARSQHLSGVVVIVGVISADGAVSSSRAISGPELLASAVLDEYKSVVYKSIPINGEPSTAYAVYYVSFSFSGS